VRERKELVVILTFFRSGKKNDLNLKLYQSSVQDLRRHMIRATHAPIFDSEEVQAHYYIGQLEGTNFVPVMEHLACFAPGMLGMTRERERKKKRMRERMKMRNGERRGDCELRQ
jgi:hypothetical protein